MRAVALAPVAALAAALLLAACQAELRVGVRVDDDGAGSLEIVLGADEALLDAGAEAGIDPLAELAATGRGLDEAGWTVAEAARAGGRSVALRAAFDDPDDFNALAGDLADALDAPEGRLIERLALEVDDGELRLVGAVGVEAGEGVADYGLAPAEAEALLAEHDAFVLEVVAELPGELVETTADTTGPPLRWTAGPGERVEILAVTALPQVRWTLVAAASAAGLALGVLAALALSRARGRRGRSPRSSRTRT